MRAHPDDAWADAEAYEPYVGPWSDRPLRSSLGGPRFRVTAGRGYTSSGSEGFMSDMIDRLAVPRSVEVAASVPEADTEGSFEAFFEAHRDRLFGSMVLLTGDRHEAEELTQDAFVAVWERWGRIRTMDEPVGYLYRTAMNRFRKRLRRRSVALRRTPWRSEPADELARVDARHTMTAALATLPPRQRAAVVLTELFDLPSEEAGRVLGVRAGTVRALAHQGRAALRAAIGGDHG